MTVIGQGPRQNARVRCSEVQPLGSRGRNDMRGIAGQKQTSVLHGVRNETPRFGDVLLDRAFVVHEQGHCASSRADRGFFPGTEGEGRKNRS